LAVYGEIKEREPREGKREGFRVWFSKKPVFFAWNPWERGKTQILQLPPLDFLSPTFRFFSLFAFSMAGK
jgi:hypothetical protein